jgi:hypothetical protein
MCADPLFVFATGGFPNCYTKYNYASQGTHLPYQFDLKDDPTKCYSPAMIPLSGPTEKYNTAGTPCYGLVDEYFVLPGTKIDPSFTVLQPAYAVQNIINTGLSTSFSSFPHWLTPDCNAALRQYFCYQYFFKPQAVTVRQGLITGVAGTPYQAMLPQIQSVANNLYPGLLNRQLYFPRYANRSMCHNYENVCSEFRFRAQNPLLEPNCSKRTGGFQLFPPSENQTLLSTKFRVTLGGSTVTLNLKFNTAPDYSGYRNDTRLDYSVMCPPNYSINPDLNDENIDDVPGSGCAVNCRTGFWTNSEWSSFDQFGVIVSGISFVFCVIVMIMIIATSDWKASYLIFFFTCTSLVSSVYHLAITAGIPWEERFCSSAVERRRVRSGASDCLRHAIISSFLYLAGCILIFLMALQRALELSGNRAVLSRPFYIIFQILITLCPPAVSVALAWIWDYLGFAGATPWCAMDLMPSIYLMGFPVLVICGFTYGIYLYGTVRGMRGQNSAKVAVANSGNQVHTKEIANSAVSNIPSGMTVISIGAAVDITPVRGFDEEETINVASLPFGGVATPAPPSDIEMKQMAATKYAEGPEQEVVHGVSSKPTSTEATAHNLRVNILITAFIIGSLVIHIGWVIIKFGNFFYGQKYYDSFVNYSRCIFRNWDFSTDESYIKVCGTHPPVRPAHSGIQFYILCLFGNMLVMGPMYIVSSLIAYHCTEKVKNSK